MTTPNWAVFKHCLNVFPSTVKCNEIKKNTNYSTVKSYLNLRLSVAARTPQPKLQSSSPACTIWIWSSWGCCEPAPALLCSQGWQGRPRTALARLWAADELCWFISSHIYLDMIGFQSLTYRILSMASLILEILYIDKIGIMDGF